MLGVYVSLSLLVIFFWIVLVNGYQYYDEEEIRCG